MDEKKDEAAAKLEAEALAREREIDEQAAERAAMYGREA